jgi:hypothetical protein
MIIREPLIQDGDVRYSRIYQLGRGFTWLYLPPYDRHRFSFIIPIILLLSLTLCGTGCFLRRDVAHITFSGLASMAYGHIQPNSCIEIFYF